jgi:hypothetical protein
LTRINRSKIFIDKALDSVGGSVKGDMASTGKSGAGLLPLTFGVELEMLFALNKNKVRLNPQFHYLFPQYYALDPQDQVDDRMRFDPTSDEARGLCQAATILRHSGVDLAIKLNPKDDEDLFHRWSLTLEDAVEHPVGDWEISSLTDGVVTTRENVEFVGIELISPIMQAPDIKAEQCLEGGSFQELERVLEAVNGDPSRVPWMFISQPENSGFHVHVGMQPDKDWGPVDIPLKVLQHLAWIVVTFEDVITLLHHPERHGYWETKIHDHACSNRRAFTEPVFLDPVIPLHLHSCEKALVYDQLTAFNQIFGSRHHEHLRDVMSNKPGKNNFAYRNTFVNFYNIASTSMHPEPIKTVEFRQHCGTIDPEEVKEWVYFVTSLVRAAERKANEQITGPDSNAWYDWEDEKLKYKTIFASKKRTFKELFDLMELPIDRRRYWWERAQEFRSHKFTEYWKFGTCHPLCTGFMPRDSEGWEEGELIEQPWSLPSSPHDINFQNTDGVPW